jgi:hypothetical protein
MRARRLLAGILSITVLLTGCMTMRPVELSPGEGLTGKVAPNDIVRVWTRDGRTLDLHVTAVEPDALVGKEQRVPIKDIARLERQRVNWTVTTLIIVGVAALTMTGIALTSSPAY